MKIKKIISVFLAVRLMASGLCFSAAASDAHSMADGLEALQALPLITDIIHP